MGITYVGNGGSTAADPAVVSVREDGQPTRLLRHVVRHSPTGFAWGYAGSGPADLARSLLVDALGAAALCPDCAGTGKVVWTPDSQDSLPFDPQRHADLVGVVPDPDDEQATWAEGCFGCHGERIRGDLPYQDFKFDVIARLPQGGTWTLTRDEVLAWAGPRL